MKKIFILIVFSFKVAISQTYTWAANNQNLYSEGMALDCDTAGNLYQAETYTVSSANKGVNVVKYDANHNLMWVQTIKGKQIVTYLQMAITSDKAGNVYFTCTFSDSLIVGSATYFAGASPAMLLVKFNAQGDYQWSKRTFGNGVSSIKVSADLYNNVYVAGVTSGNNNFDTININGALHNYIAKYNSGGKIQWIRQTGGGSNPYHGLGFKTDGSGNSYLAGSFITTAYFGTYTVNAYAGAYFEEGYLAKIDSSGNWLWAKHIGGFGGSEQCGLSDLTLDKSGNPYVCGFTGYPSTKFDAITVTNTGEDDWILAKYDQSGNCLWAKGGGGPGSQEATAVCVDNNNEVYIARTGTFFSKFDGAGNYMWSHFKPGTLNRAMINDGQGGIYFTGTHNVNVSFDSFTLNTSNGDYRSYIARLSNPNIATALKDLVKDNAFEIYPNPANQFVTLSYPVPIKNGLLKITNASGQIVYTENLKETSNLNHEINVSLFTKGLYFVQVLEGTKKEIIQAKKLVIQ